MSNGRDTGRGTRGLHGTTPQPSELSPVSARSSVPAPLVSLVGYSLSVTIEEGGYVKAYANPPDGAGIVSYGCQGRIKAGVLDSVRQLVEEWIEANDA